MFDKYKDSMIRLLLWALLISSLVATITNLAWAFSVVSPAGSKAAWFGAVSFDGAVLIISFYARRFESGSYPRHLARAIVVTNTVISIYANVYRAIEFQQQLERISGAAWLSMPIVLGFALPLLTWALAEILVLDEDQRSHEFAREQKRVARQEARLEQGQGQTLAESCQLTRQEKLELVCQAVQKGHARNSKIVSITGIGRASVSEYLTELVAEGRLVKQGKSYYPPASGKTSGENLADNMQIVND